MIFQTKQTDESVDLGGQVLGVLHPGLMHRFGKQE